MKRLVVGALLLYAAVAAIFLVSSLTDAHGVSENAPAPWPCLQPGWTAGDHWGPGPDDIVPDVPPCPPVSAPAPAPSEEAYVGDWLPSTDTDLGPAISVTAIWVIAIIVILVAWYKLAYHDD